MGRGLEFFHRSNIPEAFANIDATYYKIETANKTHAELIVPKNIEGNTVVTAPGFADSSLLYHKFMAAVAANAHRPVYCLQHARTGMPIESYEDETDRMTYEVLSVIDHAHKESRVVDLLGTSFGSIAVGKAALQLDTKPGNKELWDNPIIGKIILNSPAGLTKDTLWELMKGMTELVAVEGAYDIKKGDIRKLGRDTADFVQYNANVPRSLKEGWDIAHTDISKDLAILGNRTYLIHTTDDLLFPFKRVFEGADRANIPKNHRYILPGRHGGFIDERFISIVQHILAAREQECSSLLRPTNGHSVQIYPATSEELVMR